VTDTNSRALPADGLDLSTPDVTTDEEIAAFREYYYRTKNGLNQSFEFWLEFRPSVLKRHKARTPTYTIGDGSAVAALAALHAYAVDAFSDGVEYEIELAQSSGATREDVLDTLSLAFIHGGHPAMYSTVPHRELIRSYREHPRPDRFPANWAPRPGFFHSGMDHTTLQASTSDVEALRSWYESTIGYVPAYVQFAARHRPDHLKAYRSRFEFAVSDSFPAQFVPYLLLHHHVITGSVEGMRENALLCRVLGVTDEQLRNAVFSASLHCGAEAYALADSAIGDLLSGAPA
jgi:hypothetical protein